ncbi:uncharacterized protein LOC135847051 [Planococcus citri]|uniref:uncharacterized protein LOC135847051 n=1 Tax=Planococcus citri TaxID=170843 RepID=UPI0031F84A1E
MTSNSDSVTWLANILLRPLKIYENTFNYAIYSTIFILFSAFSILGNIIGFLNVTGTVDKLEALVAITSQLNGVLLYLGVHRYRKQILQLFIKLEEKQPNTDAIPNRTEVFVKIKLIWFSVALGISTTLFVASSLITYFMEDKISDKHSLLIPFWFSCGDPNFNRVLCWETSTKDDLLAKNIILFGVVNTQIFAYISSFVSFGINVGQLEMHLQNIEKRVDRLNSEADEAETAINGAEKLGIELSEIHVDEDDFHRQFLEIIKYQQFLYGCIKSTVQPWKTYVSYYYASAIVDVTLLLFSAGMEYRNEKSLALRAMTLCQMRLLMAFIIAHCSHIISHLNEDFSHLLAKIRWYERNAKFQKIYLRMLCFHQKTNVMKIYGIMEVNFNFYANMLNKIYSFVNLLILRYKT